MEPTKKAPPLDFFMKGMGYDRQKAIRTLTCVWCKKPARVFRDQLSLQEYRISGLCQTCQDETFGD